jgi:O-methyltransferase
MENAVKRQAARFILGGHEATVVRIALASRFATTFAHPKQQLSDRFALYERLSRDITRGRSFDYLEFGVFKGESITKVAELNDNPDARFFGFDSFEGLPSDWNEKNPRGTFSVNGCVPRVTDPRITFIKGWFDQSLPLFLVDYTPQAQLWIHIDADLYGSAMAALTMLNPHIRPGTIIVFDEIADLMNEFKALCDYQDMSGKKMDLIGSTQDCGQAAFICR